MSDLEVTPEHAQRELEAGRAQVIDVREAFEHEAGHVGGSVHIELQQLSSQAATIARDLPVIFVCRVGGRSLMAAQAFRQAGFEAYSMAGGVERWADESRPLQPDDGYVAGH